MLLPIDTENINSKKFDTIQFTSYKPLEYKNIINGAVDFAATFTVNNTLQG